ncbi:Leucine efflux protein [Fusobacterium sp. DD1]|uniref:LysE family translocator n=2 Tax=unclassified Fusobacterium TaxID=2648384 RepID=UPI001B8D658B|nr:MULTISPECIES: LysE family translocator [unclassified Fusobacterium]MBR8702336.1 Leucine efflux protein [Fusobacterium sp. DD45]MBR8712153.1 Leucine efflux protein [Fusobacterium sp. DD28]MBR8752730.1 Leucine efflux protein [Fusobacterium sp. DD26]MBR8777089.1 Leucine efflux protein [Fusobacterium sp. DD17]MBR8799348.1 Leucine efflux protein [Fusobacterium sp. DD12]
MFGIVNYEMYFVSCVILSLIPGSDTVYILTQSISNDRKTGVFSTLGICSGVMVHTAFVTLGLSAILKSSPTAFQVVKYVGAGYLIYLGIKSLLSKKSLVLNEEGGPKTTLKKAYFQGMMTNVLNPKVALFFIAILPGFVNTESSDFGAIAFILLGFTYFCTTSVWSLFLSFTASFASKFLKTKPGASKVINIVAGIIFIILGAQLIRMKNPDDNKEIQKIEEIEQSIEAEEAVAVRNSFHDIAEKITFKI